MPLPPHTPTLTDVSPIVGVPGTLVVSKAQFHLHAVERREIQRGRLRWDPVIQALAFTPVLGQGKQRSLGGKAGANLGGPQSCFGVSLVSSLPPPLKAIENRVRGWQVR